MNMEEDKLVQARKKELIDFLKKDRMTSAFIIIAGISFILFLIDKASFLNSISSPFFQTFLSSVHTFDELDFIMNGWLLLAFMAGLSAIFSYYRKHKYIFYPLIAWLVWLSVAVRLLPLKINPGTGKPGLWDITTNNWTLGPDLDPFLFLRWAREIVSTGTLHAIDMMRYVPLGFNVKDELVLHVYLIAWFHKVASAFGSPSIDYSAIIYPVFMFAITTVVFYLFVKKIFIDNLGSTKSNVIALISTFLFVATPSILPRTVAGIPEKEASGFLFMFMAFYFFLSAWKSGNWKSRYAYTGLASASTIIMALVWGGYIYIYMSLALAAEIAFLIGQVDRQKFIVYTAWLFSSVILISALTPRFSLYGLLTSTNTAVATLVFEAMLIYFIIEREDAGKYVKRGIFKEMHGQVISIIIMIALAVITSLFVGPTFLIDKANSVVGQLVSPTADRLGITVAENQQPYFDEWQNSFGPPLYSFIQYITGGQINFSSGVSQFFSIPIVFWLFFLSSIYLFFYFTKSFGSKNRMLLTTGFMIFMFGIIFSRYDRNSTLNGTNGISLFVYALGFFALLFALGYYGNESKKKYYETAAISLVFLLLWIVYYPSSLIIMALAIISSAYFGILAVSGMTKEEKFKTIDWGILLLFSFFFLSIISARGAVRLIMVLGPTSVIMMSAAVVILTNDILRKKISSKTAKIISVILIIILMLLTLFSMYAFFEGTKAQSRAEIPYSYTFQWQEAMAWVRNNTPQNAVFGHWWDYGYWVQTIGERATVLDGGNAIPYWDFLMGRYALTGTSNQEALDFLYAHNTTHFLIDSTDIGKYSAFSSIGSDLNGDRTSFISTMLRNNDASQELKNSTKTFYYPTGVKYQSILPLDEPIKYSFNGTNITFDPRNSALIGVSAEANSQGEVIGQANAIIVSQQNIGQIEIEIPMRYAYYNNSFVDFGSGIESGAFFMQRLAGTSSFGLEEDGALLYLSEKTVKSQLARLYLYKENNPYFTLIHSQDSPVTEQLKNSGAGNAEDIIYYNGVQGPIRIWQINYPGNMSLNQTYLQTNYSDIRLLR